MNERLANFRDGPPVVLPSMLLCDFGNLAREIADLEAAGARGLHLDVMDGHFVSNMTYGLTIVRAVRERTELPLDVHLMIDQPARHIDAFAEAGADMLTIHAEAVDDPTPVLEQIRSRGVGAGLALNPPTPLESVAAALPSCDMVLSMSVMPGYGGQEFDPVVLEKVRTLKEQLGPDVLLEVDGGVNAKTAGRCGAAGARLLVVGSAIFRRDDATYQESIAELTRLAHG